MSPKPSRAAKAGVVSSVWRRFFSKQTPTWVKIVFGLGALAYIANPWDLIPEFILGLGFLDDLVIAPLLIWVATKLFSRRDADPDPGPHRKTVKNEALRRDEHGPVRERSDHMRRSV